MGPSAISSLRLEQSSAVHPHCTPLARILGANGVRMIAVVEGPKYRQRNPPLAFMGLMAEDGWLRQKPRSASTLADAPIPEATTRSETVWCGFQPVRLLSKAHEF